MKYVDKYINPQIKNAYSDLVLNPISISKLRVLKKIVNELPEDLRRNSAKTLAKEFVVASGRSYEWTSVIYRYFLGDSKNLLFPPEPCYILMNTKDKRLIELELILSKYCTTKDIIKMWDDVETSKGLVHWTEEDLAKKTPEIRPIFDYDIKDKQEGIHVTNVGITLFKSTGIREIKAVYKQVKLVAGTIKTERKFRSLTHLDILIWKLYQDKNVVEGVKTFILSSR